VAAGAATVPLSFVFTPDEEIGSPTTRGLIEEEARQHGCVLVTEPAREGGLGHASCASAFPNRHVQARELNRELQVPRPVTHGSTPAGSSRGCSDPTRRPRCRAGSRGSGGPGRGGRPRTGRFAP